jgi:HEPN domain-containing protein
MMRSKSQPLPDPETVFMHGVRFLYTEDLLRREAVNNHTARVMAMMPAMVLSAFAAELFLKCLLILEDQTPPDSHHLGTLFKRLHNKRKSRIEELWNKTVADST